MYALVWCSPGMWETRLRPIEAYNFLKKLRRATVLDFWWCLLWVSKPYWAALFTLGTFSKIHLWCNSCWLLCGMVAEPFSSASRHRWHLKLGFNVKPMPLWNQAATLPSELSRLSWGIESFYLSITEKNAAGWSKPRCSFVSQVVTGNKPRAFNVCQLNIHYQQSSVLGD